MKLFLFLHAILAGNKRLFDLTKLFAWSTYQQCKHASHWARRTMACI